MWDKVLQCLRRDDLGDSVSKIVHVQQPDGTRRFDVFCSAEQEAVLAKLRGYGRRWGWLCRQHIPFSERPNKRQAEPRSGCIMGEASSVPGLKMASYNVCGIREKKEELRYFLRKEGVELVALQETLLKQSDWRMSLPGYHCFDVPAEANASLRGVAIVLRRGWNAYEVGDRSPGRIFVRVSREGVLDPTIIGSIYIPQTGKKAALKEVRDQVVKLRRKFPSDKLVLLGDWNLKAKALDKVLGYWGVAMVRVPVGGSPRTRLRGSRNGIDHVVVSAPHVRTVATGKVRRNYDLSDHWPLITQFTKSGLQQTSGPSDEETDGGWRFCLRGVQVPRPGTSRAQWPSQFKGVVTANAWDSLAELASTDFQEESQETIDNIGSQAIEASLEVAREQGVLQKSEKKKTDVPLPRKIAKAIAQRCKAYKVARRADNLSEGTRVRKWEEYKEARANCSALLKEDRRERWNRLIRKADEDIKAEPRSFWSIASGLGNWRCKDTSVGVQPVQDASGRLLTDQDQVSKAWREYYRELACDKTGHSRDEAYWYDKVPEMGTLQEADSRGHLNADISADELAECIGKMKRHKAPGKDGIPAEFLKLGIVDVTTPMFRAMLAVCNKVWAAGRIPESWRDSIIISIPKKGDLTLMSNYRGISLMSVCLKVLMVLVTKRLEAVFEQEGLFSRSQAGFRKLEECPGQVVALYELLKRREIAGKPSYLLFVDLKKAYDTVPHGALFAKMEKYGVTGRMLSFLQGLYASSRIAVRTADRLSETVPLERGLRQGCPLSPILFNIFINDILRGTEEWGVPVESAPAETGNVSGLMFADDLVTIAPSRENLVELTQHLDRWACRNEMSFGVPKCGVMAVGTPQAGVKEWSERWLLAGQQVPVVESYTYLGMDIKPDLNLETMIDSRLVKGRKTVFAMAPFLRCRSFPLRGRLMALRAVLLPTLLYGAEVWGMKKKSTDQMQMLLNKALRLCAGASMRTTRISNVALWSELRVPPICALAAGRRARGFQKYGKLRSWVSTMVQSPFPSQRWTWVSGSARWMSAYFVKLAVLQETEDGDARHPKEWVEWEPKRLYRAVVDVVWGRENRTKPGRGVTAVWYKEAKFQSIAHLPIPKGVDDPTGLNLIVRLRVGGFWGTQGMAQAGLIPAVYKEKCLFCGRQDPETLAHFLLHCEQWRTLRESWLASLLSAMDEFNPGLDSARVTLLLGGELSGSVLPSWRPSGSSATQEVPQGATQLGSFLAAVWPLRLSLLPALGPSREERDESQSFSMGRSPEG